MDTDDQALLAHAWNFGSDFGVTDFQNDAMQKLFYCFENLDDLDPAAVDAAWAVGSQGNLLQRALSQRLAYDFTGRDNDPWYRSQLTRCGLLKNTEFLADLALALCRDERNLENRVPVPLAENFLISD